MLVGAAFDVARTELIEDKEFFFVFELSELVLTEETALLVGCLDVLCGVLIRVGRDGTEETDTRWVETWMC